MNICIVGESKTGKTEALNTLTGNTVVANFDPTGYQSIRVPKRLIPMGALETECQFSHDMHVLVLDYTLAAAGISTQMHRGGRTAAAQSAYNAFVRDSNAAIQCPDVNNIVTDGLTGLSDIVLGAVLATNQRSALQFADWGQAIDKIMEIISVLASTPDKNYVLNTHIQTDKDELTGRIKETPLVFGKQLPNRLLALFDTVFVTGVQAKTYYWLTQPQPLIQTVGSRTFRELPERIHQNFTELMGGSARDASPQRRAT